MIFQKAKFNIEYIEYKSIHLYLGGQFYLRQAETIELSEEFNKLISKGLFNRPGVAGAVL